MNKFSIPLLAALLCLSSFAAASAQQDDNGGQNRGRWQNGYASQCSGNAWRHRDRDDNDRDDNGYNRNYGNNGSYSNNGGYYGNNGGYYGNNGNQRRTSACNSENGNAVVRGSIVGVNGNEVTLQNQSSQRITIDDQPALNNQSSGRVAIGRFVTAYGYWRNGIFYATRMD